MKNFLISLFACCTLFAAQFAQSQATVDPELQKLLQEHVRRQNIMAIRLIDQPSVRSTVENVTGATFLSESVILDKAKKLNLTANEQETHTFILPMLASQGLVDYSCTNVFKDPNVLLWLKGQGMPLEDFKNAAQATVLWAKIVTQNISVTDEEVKKYVTDNPGLASAPARVLIELTQFTPPPKVSTRSMLVPEFLAPCMELNTRATLAELEKPLPEEHKHLQVRMELDKLDKQLRQAISGLRVGDHFGPLLLANGAIVEGTVKGFIGETDFSNNSGFWELASIRARIEKAKQGEVFAQMVETFIDNCPSEAVRGFWGKVWGGFKRSFSYATGAGVGLAAFISTGDPRIAYLGARYGKQMGDAIKGAFSSGNSSSFPVQMMKNIPSMFRSGNFNIPAAYYPQTQPRYPEYIPAMPASYNPNYWYPQPLPRPMPSGDYNQGWSPQMFFPMPAYY